jgi:ribosomal protein S18 acetylase RimI-like enzyme
VDADADADVAIEPAAMDDVSTLADLWVDLAAGQRAYRSHLLAAPNRAAVADALARSVVRGDLLVARGSGDATDGDGADAEPDGAPGSDRTPEPDGGGGDAESDREVRAPSSRYGPPRRLDAREGGAPVAGFVMFGVESGTYEQDATIGAVHNLYVRPGARNAGVGSALLDAAERALADAGADAVSLEAMVDNEAALRFYERRGYRPHRVELEKPLDRPDRPASADDAAGSDSH